MGNCVCAIGRMKAGPERELADRYLDRLKKSGRAIGLADITVHETPESRAADALQRQQDEANALLKPLTPDHRLVVFDERGKGIDSVQFARALQSSLDSAEPQAFLIGGPDGLSDSVRNRARLVVSFGAMTLPHQLVRVLVLEQIYRATTILTGHPYHRA